MKKVFLLMSITMISTYSFASSVCVLTTDGHCTEVSCSQNTSFSHLYRCDVSAAADLAALMDNGYGLLSTSSAFDHSGVGSTTEALTVYTLRKN